MIFAHVKDPMPEGLPENIEIVLAYMRGDIAASPVGKYPLSDTDFVNIQEYAPKVPTEDRYEAHRHYVDIQLILEGEETVKVADTGSMEITVPYSDERDVMFGHATGGKDYLLRAGDYLILYPEDAHMPCIRAGSETVKKAVGKVRIG